MNGIEFRWFLTTQFLESATKNIYGDKMILQYRERLNPLEEGLHPAIWSEWQDVPFARF